MLIEQPLSLTVSPSGELGQSSNESDTPSLSLSNSELGQPEEFTLSPTGVFGQWSILFKMPSLSSSN